MGAPKAEATPEAAPHETKSRCVLCFFWGGWVGGWRLVCVFVCVGVWLVVIPYRQAGTFSRSLRKSWKREKEVSSPHSEERPCETPAATTEPMCTCVSFSGIWNRVTSRIGVHRQVHINER